MFFWKREKRDTKRIQAVSPWRILFDKGRRETQKNSQAVSPLNSLESEKGDIKEFRRLVLLFFWQREKRRKDSTLLFSAEFSLAEKTRFGKPENFGKLFGKRKKKKKKFKETQKSMWKNFFYIE